MRLRKACPEDTDLLVRLRLDYLFDLKPLPAEDELRSIRENLCDYFRRWIGTDSFAAIIAEENGEALSTAFLCVTERPPRSAASCRTGTVYNVFTYPGHRRKGLATKVMLALMEEARGMNLSTVDLLASEDGKPLYHSLGFQVSKHISMQIRL